MGCGDSPRLPKGVKARKVGDGAEAGATIGPLIDRTAIAKVEQTSVQPNPSRATASTGGGAQRRKWSAPRPEDGGEAVPGRSRGRSPRRSDDCVRVRPGSYHRRT